MTAERLIFVLGTPSGGTSCVAGILYHLGVDMGKLRSEPTARGYVSFEDVQGVEYAAASPRGEGDPLVPLLGGYRQFRNYVADRLASAPKGKRVGAKLGSKYWLGDPEPETLPLDIVRVRRPWVDALESDLRHTARVWGRELDDLERVERAAAMGGYWHAAELLEHYVLPVVTLEWSEILERPMDAVRAIYQGLRLSPSPHQIKDAWESVEVKQ